MMNFFTERLTRTIQEHSVLKGANASVLPGTSTNPVIACTNAAIASVNVTGKPLYILHEDKSKTFDTIPFASLERSLRRIALPEPAIRFYVDGILRNRTASVIPAYGPADPFDIGRVLHDKAFVDDLAIFASSPDDLQKAADLISEFNHLHCIKSNPSKSTIMAITFTAAPCPTRRLQEQDAQQGCVRTTYFGYTMVLGLLVLRWVGSGDSSPAPCGPACLRFPVLRLR